MPIRGGKYVSPTWHNGAPPALDAAELQAMTDSIANTPVSGYAVCSTVGTDKAVNIPGFQLVAGVQIAITFVSDVESNSTLNINGTGAKSIWWYGVGILGGVINTGSTACFVFTGTYWYLLSVDLSISSMVSFSNASWSDISVAISTGIAKNIYSIGDTKTISLTTGESIVLRIEDFDHDNLTAGGKAPMTISTLNCLNEPRKMNSTSTNVGGWGSSELRGWMSGTLFSQLPIEVRNLVKPVNKLTSAGNRSTSIVTTSDKLWLPSFTEVNFYPSTSFSPGGEGGAYPLFIGNISRIKSSRETPYFWWLRSPYISNTTSFDYVGGDGAPSSNGAVGVSGVVFGFCI